MIGTTSQFRAHHRQTDAEAEVLKDLVAVTRAQAQVRLVAPRDTADAATNLWRAVQGLNGPEPVFTDADVQVNLDAFVALAKRDLGVPAED